MIELLVFESAPQRVMDLRGAGYSSFIVDLELMGKDLRQLGYDTEINRSSFEDIATLKSCGVNSIWTRINCFGEHTAGEVEEAIARGSSSIILPMVRSTQEVDAVLGCVNGRAELCVMIETREGVEIARQIAGMPVSSAYFGLNDFAISTGNRNIFAAVADGTVARTREHFKDRRFGFGGLTHPGGGAPVSSRAILRELERTGCSFTFLRRSFKRDLARYGAGDILESIGRAWVEAGMRTGAQRRQDHLDLVSEINAVSGASLI